MKNIYYRLIKTNYPTHDSIIFMGVGIKLLFFYSYVKEKKSQVHIVVSLSNFVDHCLFRRFWPLHCLSFEFRFLAILLVTSNISYNILNYELVNTEIKIFAWDWDGSTSMNRFSFNAVLNFLLFSKRRKK